MERLTEKHYGTDGYYMKCSEDCANDDEMCGGCPYLDKIIDRLGAYEDTGLTPEQVAAIAKDNNVPGKWIPVTEKLPEPYVDVITLRVDLLTEKYHAVGLEYITLYGEANIPTWSKDHMTWQNKVTHWMPLPEPPKENDHG